MTRIDQCKKVCFKISYISKFYNTKQSYNRNMERKDKKTFNIPVWSFLSFSTMQTIIVFCIIDYTDRNILVTSF